MPSFHASGRKRARPPSPQLLQLLEEQKREGSVVTQPQKIWRETLPVRQHSLIAADFNQSI
jgi:hypothetical protein